MPWQNVGSPFIVISPANGIFLVYELPGPGAGTLIASIVPPGGPTVDQYGNPLEPGITEYVLVGTDTYAVNLAAAPATNPFTGAGLSIQDLTHPPYSPAGVYGLASSNNAAQLALWSGLVSNTDVAAYILMGSQDSGGITNGFMNLIAGRVVSEGSFEVDATIQAAAVTDGMLFGVDPTYDIPSVNAGLDGQNYTIGTTDHVFVASGQVINNGLTTITGSRLFITNGVTYEYDLTVIYTGNQNGGAPQFRLTFAVGGNGTVYGTNGFEGAGDNGANLLNNPGPYQGPTLVNATNGNLRVVGTVACTASGELLLQANSTVAGDTFTIDYVKIRFRPLVP